MAKSAIMVGFLILFTGGLYIFFTKSMNSLEEKLDQDRTGTPRIEISDLQVKRMEDRRVVMQLSADKAVFFEPNEIRMTGHVVGSRMNGNEEELARADLAHVILTTKSVHEAMGDVKVKTATATGKVVMIMRDYQMRTEKAVFDAASEIVSSDVPVAISGVGREIDGASGFTFALKDQILHVPGNVSGFFLPEQKP